HRVSVNEIGAAVNKRPLRVNETGGKMGNANHMDATGAAALPFEVREVKAVPTVKGAKVSPIVAVALAVAVGFFFGPGWGFLAIAAEAALGAIGTVAIMARTTGRKE
ncbi:MAG: hypothetical protein IJ087_12555, partial [Eggerthellaceae bacterium]|nr:hypothetical protein [Eggerthellaceae bacterium]